MLFHDAFLYALPVVFCLVLWVCVHFHFPFIAWWACASLILGIAGSCTSWRTSNGFHYGTGTPIPLVIWERGDAQGIYRDFPNPLGIIENPLFIFLLGLIIWGLFAVPRALVRRFRHAPKLT